MVPFSAPTFRPAGFPQKPGQMMQRLAQQSPTTTEITPAASGPSLGGIVETLLVVAISGAAAYTGVKTGLNKGQTKTNRALGWAGGVGGALIGLLYLGTKAGMSSIPQVRVTMPQGAAA